MLDPDDTDNRGTATLRAIADGTGIETSVDGSGAPTTAPVGVGSGADTGGGAGQTDGGSGCSIAGSGRQDPLLAMLFGLGLAGLLLRRRPS